MTVVSPHDERMRPELLTSINNIALDLGLPALSYASVHVPLDTDHGIIYQRLQANFRQCLSRGWWFNTETGVKFAPVEGEPTTLISDVVRVLPDTHQCYRPRVRLRTTTQALGETAAVAALEDVDNAEDSYQLKQEFTATVIRAVQWDVLPQEAASYLEKRTANGLASIFGVPAMDDDEQRSWIDLIRAQNDNEVPANMSTDNPYIWRTTRNQRNP